MKKDKFNPDYSARNGLFDRRSFLKASITSGSGMMIAGAHASEDKIRAVSYTHLTLPTNREV